MFFIKNKFYVKLFFIGNAPLVSLRQARSIHVHVLRRLEAALAHGCLRVRDSQPRCGPVFLRSYEGAVHALHGMGLVVVSRDFAVQVLVMLSNLTKSLNTLFLLFV